MAARAPSGLRPAGHRLWRAHTADADVSFRPDELAILELAARTADEIAGLERALADAPRTVAGSKGQDAVHPLIPELRLQRQLLASLLARLRIPEPDGGAPGEWDNLSASDRGRRAAAARWGRRG